MLTSSRRRSRLTWRVSAKVESQIDIHATEVGTEVHIHVHFCTKRILGGFPAHHIHVTIDAILAHKMRINGFSACNGSRAITTHFNTLQTITKVKPEIDIL